jgi:large subunit ribosomal protein L19
MSKILDQFNKAQLKPMPDIKSGQNVKVHQRIKEGNKDRIQIFEGIIIARKHGKGINSTITVRKVSDGIGVERIFPVFSPAIEKIEIIRAGKTRRAKLYYLRTAKGKKARLKNKEFSAAIAEEEKPVVEEVTETTNNDQPAEAVTESTPEEKSAE